MTRHSCQSIGICLQGWKRARQTSREPRPGRLDEKYSSQPSADSIGSPSSSGPFTPGSRDGSENESPVDTRVAYQMSLWPPRDEPNMMTSSSALTVGSASPELELMTGTTTGASNAYETPGREATITS